MVILARGVEHPLNMTVQGSHDTYPREHRRAVIFRNKQERQHRGLPFLGIVLCLRQLGDVERGVAERDQRFPSRQYDRIEKLLFPRHEPTPLRQQIAFWPCPLLSRKEGDV
jgi:hypothetical protein